MLETSRRSVEASYSQTLQEVTLQDWVWTPLRV